MNEEKFIYNPIVKEYLKSLENYKDLLQNECDTVLKGIIDSDDDLTKFINGKVNDSYIEIINNISKIISWWKSYDDSVELLSNGLTNDKISNNAFESIKFQKVKEIINEELK